MIYDSRQPLTAKRIRRTFRALLQTEAKTTRQIHSSGYRLRFHTVPPTVKARHAPAQASMPEDPQLQAKWNQLVTEGHARIIHDNSKGFYSPSFTIPKKQKGEHRLINDMRMLNSYISQPRIRMRGLPLVLRNLVRHSWLIGLDIENGYYNVRVHADDCKFLRYIVGGVVYELQALPMGLVCSMDAFRQWLRPVLNTIRTLLPQVTTYAWVDDLLFILPRSRARVARQTSDKIRLILSTLQIPIKPAKSSWRPSRELTYLGFHVNSRTMLISVPKKKAKEVIRQIHRVFKKDQHHSLLLRHLASCIGKLMALLPAAPEGRLHSRNLYDLQTRTVRHHGWDPQARVRLSLSQRSELHWWKIFLLTRQQRKIASQFTCSEISILASDASDYHIAGTLVSNRSFPRWSRALSRRECRQTINQKEALAVYESLLEFQHHIQGTHINVRCDNATVVAGINKWGCRSPGVNTILRLIYTWCLRTDSLLTATYIPSAANRMADALSRGQHISQGVIAETAELLQGILATKRKIKWHITPHGFRHVCNQLRTRPRVNLLEETSSREFLRSAHPEHAIPSHLVSHPTNAYFAFPQLHAISKTLDLIESLQISTTMTLPLWPGAPYFNRIARLSVSRPILIANDQIYASGQEKKSKPSWNWIGLQLSGRKSRRTAYRRRTFGNPDSKAAPSDFTAWVGGIYENISTKTKQHLQRFWNIARSAKV